MPSSPQQQQQGTSQIIYLTTSPFIQFEQTFWSKVRIKTWFRTNNSIRVEIDSNGSTAFSNSINITGTVTASSDVVAFSDERLKTNVKTLDGSKVYDMRGVSFTKDDKKGSGVIAQELEKIAPELVNNESEFKSVAYGNITGYLIEAIKDLKQEIEDLKKQIK